MDGRIFIAGDGLSDRGPQPFLDVLDLEQRKVQRVFSAEPGVDEIALGVVDPTIPEFVTSRESEMESPNLYLHRGTERLALTQVADHFPQLAQVIRRVVSYQRADGARRFFHALVGAGSPARYVELPYEGHHYWARENVLLASVEMLDWLDKYIGPRSHNTATGELPQ